MSQMRHPFLFAVNFVKCYSLCGKGDNHMNNNECADRLKNSDLLDQETISRIKSAYFTDALLVPVILFVAITAAIILMIVFKVSTAVYFVFTVVFAVLDLFLLVRIIAGLITSGRIGRGDFLWDTGVMNGFDVVWGRNIHVYAKVDNGFYCSVTVNPIYKKGTEVYFLAIGGQWEQAEGVMVRLKADK